MHTGFVNAIVANSMLARGMLQHNNQPNYNNNQQGGMQRNNGNSDNRRHGSGDADPYSGLMSAREKQWLMNIQMMQLNTGTPYIDDYYYMVRFFILFSLNIIYYDLLIVFFFNFRCF